MVIDLHGMGHTTAPVIVEKRLIEASEKGAFEAEIITGKSVVMNRIVCKVLDDWGFDYVIFEENLGVIYVSYTPL